MKRPLTFVLIAASVLAGSSAFAANDGRAAVTQKLARDVVAKNDSRGHDGGKDRRNDGKRGDDKRGSDRRDHDRGHDNARSYHPPGNNNRYNGPPMNSRPGQRNYDRRDHDRRNDGRRDNDRRYDGRRDHDRHDWDRRNNYVDRNHNGRDDRWDRYRRDWKKHPNYWDNRRHDRRDYARYRYHYGVYHRPAGWYYRVWHRGDRLPRAWYGHSYIIYDWHPYRLYAPPYGYHWVRVGNDVLLTAIATGIVLDVIYDIWW